MKRTLLLAQRAAIILTNELRGNDKRKIQNVSYQLDRALSHIGEISSVISGCDSGYRVQRLTTHNLAHLRRKMMRVRMDFVFLFCEEIEIYAPLLSSKLTASEWIDLTVMRFNLPYQWGLILSLDPLPDLHKLKQAMH